MRGAPLAVAAAADTLTRHARSGDGPAFLEAVTYRHRGHVGPKEDVDVGVRRTMSELTLWKRRDPIERLIAAMHGAGMIGDSHCEALRHELGARVATARERAEAAPYPDATALLGAVYRGQP